jgi:RNA recognition motif-containing protein
MHIYIGKLTIKTSGKKLRKLFGKYGSVDSANVYEDRFRADSDVMGFVEMPNESEARKAIKKLNGKLIKGVPIEVHPARSRDLDRRSGLECRSDAERRKAEDEVAADNRAGSDRRTVSRRSGKDRRTGFEQ